MSDDELNAVVAAATEFFDQHLVDVTPEECRKILGRGLSEIRRAHPDVAEAALCLAVGRAWGRLDAARDRAAEPALVRWLFSPHGLWPALVHPEIGGAVRSLTHSAALTAAGQAAFENTCGCCAARWGLTRQPAGVVVAHPIGAADLWSVDLICSGCWTGDLNAPLRGALERKYGIARGSLQILPEVAGNA
jgi:hypothetical protein